ncbi:hypothetical protein KA405_03130 [Patescibacteria group bacterium]|nr:hypothetical protein [Patescibacteria group bacterium]
MLIAEDKHPFVHDFPNKSRYTKKLEEVKQTNPAATLADVVKEKQIYYSMKNKESCLNSVSVPYSEIEKHIIDYIKQIKIDEDSYKHYMAYCSEQYEIERNDREKKRKKMQLQRNALA